MKHLTDQLWDVFVEAFPEHVAVKRGTKPKADNKTQVKVLILDLNVSHLEDPCEDD